MCSAGEFRKKYQIICLSLCVIWKFHQSPFSRPPDVGARFNGIDALRDIRARLLASSMEKFAESTEDVRHEEGVHGGVARSGHQIGISSCWLASYCVRLFFIFRNFKSVRFLVFKILFSTSKKPKSNRRDWKTDLWEMELGARMEHAPEHRYQRFDRKFCEFIDFA